VANLGLQIRLKQRIERIFTKSCNRPVAGFIHELDNLGFTLEKSTPSSVRFQNRVLDLLLEIQLDARQCVNGYRFIPIS